MSEQIPAELADMKIGDSTGWNNYEILRVPGGWIYTCHQQTATGDYRLSSAFVPMLEVSEEEIGDASADRYKSTLREIYEEYAGMEGFVPKTAPEAYQQQIIERMAEIAREALEK